MKSQRFFKCNHCGNIIGMIEDKGVPVSCCGENMTELVSNTSDGAHEKHLPVITVNGNKLEVSVGSTLHPMLAEHYIQWIYVELENGGMRKSLAPNSEPKVVFNIEGEKPVAVYEYCNLHGLWKVEL